MARLICIFAVCKALIFLECLVPLNSGKITKSIYRYLPLEITNLNYDTDMFKQCLVPFILRNTIADKYHNKRYLI